MFHGAYTALITPFREGELDEQALRALVAFQIDNGIHGLVPIGTTGRRRPCRSRNTGGYWP